MSDKDFELQKKEGEFWEGEFKINDDEKEEESEDSEPILGIKILRVDDNCLMRSLIGSSDDGDYEDDEAVQVSEHLISIFEDVMDDIFRDSGLSSSDSDIEMENIRMEVKGLIEQIEQLGSTKGEVEEIYYVYLMHNLNRRFLLDVELYDDDEDSFQ